MPTCSTCEPFNHNVFSCIISAVVKFSTSPILNETWDICARLIEEQISFLRYIHLTWMESYTFISKVKSAKTSSQSFRLQLSQQSCRDAAMLCCCIQYNSRMNAALCIATKNGSHAAALLRQLQHCYFNMVPKLVTFLSILYFLLVLLSSFIVLSDFVYFFTSVLLSSCESTTKLNLTYSKLRRQGHSI